MSALTNQPPRIVGWMQLARNFLEYEKAIGNLPPQFAAYSTRIPKVVHILATVGGNFLGPGFWHILGTHILGRVWRKDIHLRHNLKLNNQKVAAF